MSIWSDIYEAAVLYSYHPSFAYDITGILPTFQGQLFLIHFESQFVNIFLLHRLLILARKVSYRTNFVHQSKVIQLNDL